MSKHKSKTKIPIIIKESPHQKLYYRVDYDVHKKNCYGDLSKSKRDPARQRRIRRILQKSENIFNIYRSFQNGFLVNDQLSIRQAKNLANKLSNAKIYGKPMFRNIKIVGYYEFKN